MPEINPVERGERQKLTGSEGRRKSAVKIRNEVLSCGLNKLWPDSMEFFLRKGLPWLLHGEPDVPSGSGDTAGLRRKWSEGVCIPSWSLRVRAYFERCV